MGADVAPVEVNTFPEELPAIEGANTKSQFAAVVGVATSALKVAAVFCDRVVMVFAPEL